MYEKETDSKLDELISLVKAMDTKLRFVMEDIEEIKQAAQSIDKTVVETAMVVNLNADRSSSEQGKAARLAAFREQTARW